MAKELIGTIKTPQMEERTEVWAEEKADCWRIFLLDPEENRQDTEHCAKSAVEALVLACNIWGTEEWDLRLADEG